MPPSVTGTDSEALAEGYDAWARAQGLAEALAPLRHTVLRWVEHAVPATTPLAARVRGCVELALFFHLDDYLGADESDLFARCEGLFASETAGSDASPILAAWSEHLAYLARSGLSLARYRAGRAEVVRCYRRRNLARRAGTPFTFESFLALRMVTIYMAQWIELWELLDADPLDAAERAEPAIAAALTATTRWHVLRNEVASTTRDLRSGQHNLVLLHASERGLDRCAASHEVLALAEEALAELASARRTILATPRTGRIHRYLELLDASVAAALDSYGGANPARYGGGP